MAQANLALHTGDQLAGPQRLGQIVVGAATQPGDFPRGSGDARHHDDRHLRAERISAKAVKHLLTGHVRKACIQQYYPRLVRQRYPQPFLTMSSHEHRKVSTFQGSPEGITDVDIIVNDQHNRPLHLRQVTTRLLGPRAAAQHARRVVEDR